MRYVCRLISQTSGVLAAEKCPIHEFNWSSTTDVDTKRDIENVMAFVIIGFMVTLRGEEVPLARIEGIARMWREDYYQYRVPFVMITLRGRFKREKHERFHCLPIADRGNNYDELFKSYVKRAHAKAPREFASGTKLDQYSLRRSLRRGSTTTAGNNQVPQPVVDRINPLEEGITEEEGTRWRASRCLKSTYTEVKNSIDSALSISESPNTGLPAFNGATDQTLAGVSITDLDETVSDPAGSLRVPREQKRSKSPRKRTSTATEPNEDHVVGCDGETAGEGRQGSRRGAGRDRDHDAPKNCWPSDHGVWEPRPPQNG
ncbi:hypothetical protein THAOC_32980 [Thalassiosira oceanica]|uniref:Uncharacterized protein n=1 Tax=Thalassiosira oceanica TaxID=159749 RepID=K0R647_THAOC|nr:hypothetical protein THAOC_32980 [Thalassiosira oceanica]|eukprot:EJK48240.1 hypothetical protein THAOC_32980 [Thalassiosira oceanica]